MNKSLKKQFFLILPASSILLGVVWFLVWRLGIVSQEILSLKAEAYRNQQLFENFSILKIQKKQAEPIQKKVAIILPTKDSILSLTSRLEQIGLNLGLKQSFVFGAEGKPASANISEISFSLVLNGKIENFTKYLEQLESLPQLVQLGTLEISKADKDYQFSGVGRIFKK